MKKTVKATATVATGTMISQWVVGVGAGAGAKTVEFWISRDAVAFGVDDGMVASSDGAGVGAKPVAFEKSRDAVALVADDGKSAGSDGLDEGVGDGADLGGLVDKAGAVAISGDFVDGCGDVVVLGDFVDGAGRGDGCGDRGISTDAGDGARFEEVVEFVGAVIAWLERISVVEREIASTVAVAFAAAARRVVVSSTRAATSTGDVARKNRRKTAGPSGERFRPSGRMILRNFERCERRRGALCMSPTFHVDP
jgi:hypothetical protein